MEAAYILSGGLAVIHRHQVAVTFPDAGVPALMPAAEAAGVAIATTTGADNMAGLTVDASDTYATAQNADNSDPDALVGIIVNPDLVFEAKLSGGAAEDTALALFDVTAVSTSGLDITAGDFSGTTFDEGAIFGFDGANVSILRKITSVSTTVATVTVAFPFDTVVGDNFLATRFWPFQANTATLTTLLTQIRNNVAVATNTAALRTVELKMKDTTDDGRNTSKVNFISGNHVFGGVLA